MDYILSYELLSFKIKIWHCQTKPWCFSHLLRTQFPILKRILHHPNNKSEGAQKDGEKNIA